MKQKYHSIDFAFVLLLFCLFSMSSLALISIGSHVYSSTVNTLEQNYTQSTIIDYIQQKVRQNLSANQIEVKTFDNLDVLCIHETQQGHPYTTYIYHDQSSLKELYIGDEQSFDKERGETIMNVDNVAFQINHDMLKIIVDNNSQTIQAQIALIGG